MVKRTLRLSATSSSTTVLGAEIAALTERLAALRAHALGKTVRHRMRDRLSDRRIAVLKIPGFYADGGNLYLDFKDPPSKNWVLRYRRGGRVRDMGLGS